MSSSKPTNQIVQNLYRFLIDLLPLKNVEMPNLSHLSFSTRSLGWFVNQRNPSGYWQVTKGDLSQIISFLHDLFSLGLAFSSVWLRAMISGRFFYSEFASFCRAQLEFSYFLFFSKTPWRWEVKSRNFNSYPWRLAVKSRKYCPRRSTTRFWHGVDVWMGHGSGP